jgi:glucose-6-phosphate isomerase
LWKRYKEHLCHIPGLRLTLDVSRMRFADGFFERMAEPLERAFEAMDALERGAIANPDENRMVGHYWLRAPELATNQEIGRTIRKTIDDVKSFAAAVHAGEIRPPQAPRFAHRCRSELAGRHLAPCSLLIALGSPSRDRMEIGFIDDTDSDGIARVLESLHRRLNETALAKAPRSKWPKRPAKKNFSRSD